MKGRFTFIFFIYCMIVLPFAVIAQDRTVSGKVTDRTDGKPIPGVTVRLQGTTRAVMSDASGNFSIAVPTTGARLTFTQVGMTSQTIAVPSSGTVNIALDQDSQVLDQVVVVGYGTQKKSVVTGSISSVKASQLESMPINRVEQALQGRTSGVTVSTSNGQPGSSSNIRIRGYSTFAANGDNNPLWVVDGVIVDNGGIGYINQADIESIEVLKDAASTAIYGTRAANGVIIVTTKKGKSGLQINYNGYYGISAAAKKLDLLNATQYATLRNEAAVNAGVAAPYANPGSFGEGTDWQSLIFNDDARRQTHEFSVAGGSDKASVYGSFGYITQEGIVLSDISKWNRANVRLNTTFKPNKWITFGENLGYSHSVSTGIGNTNSEFGGPLSSAISLDPITPAIENDPAKYNAAPYTSANVVRAPNGNPYGISPVVGQEMSNPLAYQQTRLGNYGWDHNIVGNVFGEVTPIKGLLIRSSLGTKIAFYGSESYRPLYYLQSSNISSSTNFYREMNYTLNYNWENTISYGKDFGKHNVNLLVGQGYYLDNNNKNVNVSFNNVIAKNFYEGNLNYKPINGDRIAEGGDATVHVINSLFTRLNYNYDEKYLVTGILRRDGSSRFGSNNKFGVFPSFSLGWVPTREGFWPENKVVNFLKVRGGYGVTGNDSIGDFAYVGLVGSGRNYTFGTTDQSTIGWSPASPSNPDLKWEQTSQAGIGFDATILTNFTLTVDLYKKKTTGNLQYPGIPAYLGYAGSPASNAGDTENKGIEFELGYNKTFGDLKVGFNGNATYLQNKITKLLPGRLFTDDNAQSFQGMGNVTRTTLGRSFGEFFGYDMLGIFQSQAEIDNYKSANGTVLQPRAKPGDVKFANLDGNNVIDAADRTFLGSPIPKWTYGLTLNLAYKGWDFTAFGNGVTGNQIFQGLRRLDVTFSNWQTKILDRWTPTNPSNTIPRVVQEDLNGNYTKFSKLYLESGAYFRLKTLQLGYTLPKTISQKFGSQRCRVYLMSENLFTATKYTGYDPEIGGTVLGIDRGVYPQARSFMLGLNVGF